MARYPLVHKEGYPTLIVGLIVSIAFVVLGCWLYPKGIGLFAILAFGLMAFLGHFFRYKFREPDVKDDRAIIAPADGKVVVIEEVQLTEYIQERRMQISIFMSPLDVHINWSPIAGEVVHSQYHPGKYLVAFHPKSSSENEHHSTAIRNRNGTVLLFRQIAGAMARRVVNYVVVGTNVKTADEIGFIKFGSRVDLFLPLDTKLHIKIGDKLKGGSSIIGYFQ